MKNNYIYYIVSVDKNINIFMLTYYILVFIHAIISMYCKSSTYKKFPNHISKNMFFKTIIKKKKKIIEVEYCIYQQLLLCMFHWNTWSEKKYIYQCQFFIHLNTHTYLNTHGYWKCAHRIEPWWKNILLNVCQKLFNFYTIKHIILIWK